MTHTDVEPLLYIDGSDVGVPAARRYGVVDPATEEAVGEAAEADAADVDTAVAAARRALPAWSAREPADRADLLERFADVLAAEGPRLAALVTSENGMPLTFSAVVNGNAPAATLRYYASLARRTPVEETRPGAVGPVVVRRHAVGVAGLIIPWNYPLALLMMKLAPALAAGCTTVVKPAAQTPFDALAVARLASKAGLPDGVLNVVTGGDDAGRALVAHPGVDKIAFTGSTAAGRSIAAACGAQLRPVTLELGGKSAAIVLDDADLAAAAPGLGFLAFANAGQSCFLNSRVLAPRSRFDEVVEVVRQIAGAVTVGDPLSPTTIMGPLVSEAARERVDGLVRAAVDAGATLVTGGRRPPEHARGWFYEPTVLTGVGPADRIAREEVFGPVVTVLPYDGGDDEAVRLANDSDYGLAGSVWTADPERGLAVARAVETGTIGVNGWTIEPTAPFGGWKASGLGHEFGPEGLNAYVALKSINVPGAPATGADAVPALLAAPEPQGEN